MTHQKLLSALLLFAAPYLLAQKADPTPPFDPKTAAEFLAAAPDFAEYAKTFAERADSLYSATKYDDAGAAYFASKFLGFLADYSPSASKEYVAFMLGRPELIEEFCTELSPKDDRAKVAKIILDIWDSDSATFKKYPRLALAIAIVFDAPPPKTWPHDQVSEKYLPRKFPEPVQAFADWKSARERGRLLTQFERMSIAELKYLVASLATNEDREWARKSVSLTVAGVGKLYGSVPYDYQRLNAKRFDWDGADYRLRTILKSGGICTDQAYYTAETAKSRGIPAFIFTGAGSDGFHAWTAAMKKSGDWDFGIGRYESSRFVTGTTIDPQTWEKASDHALESLREGFRNWKKYRENELHTIFAERYYSFNDWQKAEQSALKAINCDKRNEKTWRILINSRKKLGIAPQYIRKTYEDAIRSFFKYPDIDADFRRQYIAELKAAGDETTARKLSSAIIQKTKTSRPDIAMAFARAEIEEDIASGEAERLESSYKRLLGVFKNDAAIATGEITIPILNALLKKGKIAETDSIMKITRKVLKTSKDSTLVQLFDDLDRQLANIKKKHEKNAGK